MESKLKLFENEEFGRLEIIMDGDKPYFPAVECATILGYSKPHNAISRHCAHSLKRGVVSQTTNQHGVTSEQKVEKLFISEGDLYRLIIRSKLPAAMRFETWVFDEILPSIRKHGAFVTNETLEKILESPVFAQRLFGQIADERKKTAEMKAHVAELVPKARYYDVILQSRNAVQVSIIAKDYGMSAAAFNRLLHDLRIQYKIGDTWLLYQQYAGQGYTKSRTYYVNEYKSAIHTYWTQKGRLFLYEMLMAHGIVPLMEADAAC